MGIKKSRMTVEYVIIAVFLAVLIGFMIYNMLINESNVGNVGAYTTTVDAARGDILDRNGQPLVTNKKGNSITLEASEFPSAKQQGARNKEIQSLIKLFEANNVEYLHDMPIVLDGGTYKFQITDTKGKDFVKWMKGSDELKLNSYATAENCMTAIIKKFQLQGYSKEDALKIGAVDMQMERDGFGPSFPYTFADNVPNQLVTIIMENKGFYKGVTNTIKSYRTYVDGSIAPHILGRTNDINQEKYEEEQKNLKQELRKAKNKDEAEDLARNAYSIHDTYGSSGIELAFEDYLRGTRGEKTVTTNDDGTKEETYTIEPKQGDSVVLTIDKDLQVVAQNALASTVHSVGGGGGRAAAGACVVQNVNTGEILACASYPTYDNSEWKEKYSEWAKDSNQPLWNRACMSLYEPGSTFKPCTAIAALETGTINENFYYPCTGKYPYLGHVFEDAHGTAHGSVNVVSAINVSCNSFFYDVGRRLGIEKIDEWATNFGLGQKTGVEIAEATGHVSSPEERRAAGGTWYAGDVITTAIGESDNQFTLLQLSNYVSTIANGGTRYQQHFVKSIKSADYKETVLQNEPTVKQKLNIHPKNLALVKRGMYLVGTIGFCRKAFSGLPVKVGAKTGTSDVVKIINGHRVAGNNGFLISFAPFEKPEISVVVCIETADAGAKTASCAAKIYDYYFSKKNVPSVQGYNTVLS